MKGGPVRPQEPLRMSTEGWTRTQPLKSVLPWMKMRKETPWSRNGDTKEVAIDLPFSPLQPTLGLGLARSPLDVPKPVPPHLSPEDGQPFCY